MGKPSLRWDCLPLTYAFSSGLLPEGSPQLEMAFPQQPRQLIVPMRLPTQVILVCGKLTLKFNPNRQFLKIVLYTFVLSR